MAHCNESKLEDKHTLEFLRPSREALAPSTQTAYVDREGYLHLESQPWKGATGDTIVTASESQNSRAPVSRYAEVVWGQPPSRTSPVCPVRMSQVQLIRFFL